MQRSSVIMETKKQEKNKKKKGLGNYLEMEFVFDAVISQSTVGPISKLDYSPEARPFVVLAS